MLRCFALACSCVLLAVSLTAQSSSAQLDSEEVDCRTEFAGKGRKERQALATECARTQHVRDTEKAKGDYRRALRDAHTVYKVAQAAQVDDDSSSAVHQAAVEAAVSAYKEATEKAEKKRDDAIHYNTKQGAFSYGIGAGGMFPGGERRVTEAQLDAGGVVRALAYAEAEVSPMLVVSYFPRNLTWGTGSNRRWGFGPMVTYGAGGQWESLGLGLMVGVTRSGESEGPLSFGVGVAYYMNNNSRTLRRDFTPGEQAPPDGNNGFLQPVFVDTTGHYVSVVITVSIWDRPGS